MLKLALPAGELRRPLAQLLEQVGLPVPGYGEGSRSYHLSFGGVRVRVFREKDIPVQIALGNYDLGVCGLAWVEDFLVRFPQGALVKVCDLGLEALNLYVAGAPGGPETLAQAASLWGVRIASEYANLAEAFAMAARLPAYRVLSLWGAAEVYPPEDAELALIPAADEREVEAQGLIPIHCLLEGSAWLIAHRDTLRKKDVSSLLGPLMAAAGGSSRGGLNLLTGLPRPGGPAPARPARPRHDSRVRLALPDGHLQSPVLEALEAASLTLDGYNRSECQRRPRSDLPGLEIKVIRPHDMPQLVAMGNFDLAVTGRDCLLEHLYRFLSSPVEEIADLGRGQFDLSAVVSEEMPAQTIAEALAGWRSQGRHILRVASEFVNIADHYARSHHLGRYQVIPISGASEGFIPEDADLLIEGVETGRTLAENRLKAIDLLFRSTTCLIGRKGERPSGDKGALVERLVAMLAGVSVSPGRQV